eukprot:g18297.t1
MKPTAEVVEWIDVSWEALMQALDMAINDNERMILRERARQFPPPYANATEEKKTVTATRPVSGGEREDQMGPQAVVRRGQGQGQASTSTERVVGTWDEMKITITVGTRADERPSVNEGEAGGEENEEERKPPNTPIDDEPASMMADEGGEENRRAIYLNSGSTKHLVPDA